MKTNNKTRANQWEREASRILSLWLSNLERKDLFWRTASSGAKYRQTKEKNHAGDITAVDSAAMEFTARYHIEAKWKKDFSYCDLTTIKRWISIEGKTAQDLKKTLLMLVRGRKGELYLITDLVQILELGKWNIPSGQDEYLYYNGYRIFRVPAPMSMDEIVDEVNIYRREQSVKSRRNGKGREA